MTPTFGYDAPRPSIRGTLTLPTDALLSAHYDPIRHPPAIRAISHQGYKPRLDLGAFSPGPGGLLQLPLCPSHHVAAHTPPVGAAALGQISRLPLRPSHVVDRLGHRDRVTRLAMRSLALQPGELLTSLPGGFVNGLHGVGFPLPCHSSYEGLTCSLGRTFTGWITASLTGHANAPPPPIQL